MTVLDHKWFNPLQQPGMPPHVICFVAIAVGVNGWKVYLGAAQPSEDEATDARFVAERGAKVPEHIAKAVFPSISREYYR